MTEHDDLPSPRPPVLLGCVTALAALVFLFGIGSCLVVYWESGADTGKVRLELAEAYGPGTVQFVGAHNLYIARLPGGAFLALADLDAANRANPARRCRVYPIPAADPALPALLDRYRGRLSTEARGSTLIFREDCNGALYDFTGIRLDADGPNLDRYPTSIDTDGYLVVDTSRRTCTVRSGSAEAVERPCAGP
jgi:hypothetical protein